MHPDSEKKILSIIIPVYNEEENIKIAYDALSSVMLRIQNKYYYELLFTDNHSTDNTFEILRELSKIDSHIRAIRFSRNFGYQRSILMGYTHAAGNMAVQIDCDLQDPPEDILEFLKKWEMGYEVIYGVRKSRKENWFINGIRKIFYRLINFLSEDPLPYDAGDFRLVDRKVLNVLKELRDQQPYLRGTIASIGFKQIGIEYRERGKSKFKSSDMIRLALDGILNHSTIPLRIASFIGFFVTLVTVMLSIIYFIGKLIYGPLWSSGFATTTILILISIGLNGLFIGIVGEYIGRIYKQVKSSPLSIIEEKINIS